MEITLQKIMDPKNINKTYLYRPLVWLLARAHIVLGFL